jgi:hypothetical protein
MATAGRCIEKIQVSPALSLLSPYHMAFPLSKTKTVKKNRTQTRKERMK